MRDLTWIGMTLVALGGVAACTNDAKIAAQGENSVGGAGAPQAGSSVGASSNATGGTPSVGGTSASQAGGSVGGTSSAIGGSTASMGGSLGGTSGATGGSAPSMGGSLGGTSGATGGSTASMGGSLGGTSGATGGSAPSMGGSLGGTSSATGGSTASMGGSLGGTSSATGGSTASYAGAAGTTVVRSNVPPDTNPDISDTDYAPFIEGVNRFGLELSQAYTDTKGDAQANYIFSPSSAQVALAMLYGGAVGAAATAMQSTLHDQLPAGKYHVATNRMMRELQSRAYVGKDTKGNDVRIELDYANSLWADYSVGLKNPFLDLLSQNYDTGVRRLNFILQPEPSRQSINAWVAQKTNNKILDLLTAADVDSATRIVLVNALYFYGSWEGWFDPAMTSDQVFHNAAGSDVTVQAMHRTEPLMYKAGANYEVVQLPYTQKHLRFTLVLPQAGAFETVRSSVSQAFLAAASTGLASTNVALALPKFSMTTGQMNLNDALKQLGLATIFATPGFSGISDTPLTVNTVVQKAFIGADEFGTEAAASTAVSLSGALPQVTVVTVNRPFLFFIQDETGLVLFSGWVVDPTKH
jgi:serpin B